MKNKALLAPALLFLACAAMAADTSRQIQQLSDRVNALSVQIRIANSNKERDKAAELREEREQVQQQLRELRRAEREQKAEEERLAKRAAAERTWATYPPAKQLCSAIEYNRPDLVEKVVTGGQIDLNTINEYCFFPLADATARGHIEIAEYLLQKKSPLVMRYPHFQRLISAMDTAATSKQNRVDVLELLKKYGASIHDSRENSLPGTVVAGGDDVAQQMLKGKYNLSVEQLSFGSTFVRALEHGHPDNIQWLLKNGADPNETALGRTALMMAVDSNDLEKVSALIRAGADVNLRGMGYSSVLAQAEKRRARVNGRRKAEMDEIIAYLQSHGATKSEQES